MSEHVPEMRQGWLARHQEAVNRVKRNLDMADIEAVRQAMIHGEAPPADALARLEANKNKADPMSAYLWERAVEREALEKGDDKIASKDSALEEPVEPKRAPRKKPA